MTDYAIVRRTIDNKCHEVEIRLVEATPEQVAWFKAAHEQSVDSCRLVDDTLVEQLTLTSA